MEKIAVIGAGPAGVMAAYWAGKRREVTLFEKNEKIGKKLYLTGKGRCNITNNKDISEFFSQLVRNKNFMYSSFYSFTNENLVDLLLEFGLSTKVERGDRIYPASEKSSDVIKTLIKMLKDSKVDIKLNKTILKVEKVKSGFIVKTNSEEYFFDKVIVATGGLSYSSTGCNGFGYKLAKELGHNVVERKAALVPIILNNDYIKELQGLSLKNVKLTAETEAGKISQFGEMLFTSNGISGPIALTMSSYINRAKNIEIYLDLKPAITYEELDRRLLLDFEKNNNKNLVNALKELLPKSLIPIVIQVARLDNFQVVNQMTKEMRRRLLNAIKELPLEYKELMDINAAIITSGGVDTGEINPSTMESKIVQGLYFCGETIDIDALTGGYNLQVAFSTGYLAGTSC